MFLHPSSVVLLGSSACVALGSLFFAIPRAHGETVSKVSTYSPSLAHALNLLKAFTATEGPI